MQAIESETLILYQTDLRGQWHEDGAAQLAARLPYGKRLALRASRADAPATLAGIALALRALTRLLDRVVAAGELVFAPGEKPRLATLPADGVSADFSISHSGPWVACAVLPRGQLGLDIEMGSEPRIAEWVAREAALKAVGAGIREFRTLETLCWQDGTARWRGSNWHLKRLDEFAGACACVVSSVALGAVQRHSVGLAELFAP
jgi:4'-phosphopantetheinyl transferase EntD